MELARRLRHKAVEASQMVDKLTVERRSENMRRIKSRDMKPELLVRSIVHRMGYRFRLHDNKLPGKPDLVFRARKKIVQIHGCFWHSHALATCLDGRSPKSNTGYWWPKLKRNKERDAETLAALEAQGWKVLIIWECETRDSMQLSRRLEHFLNEKTTSALPKAV